MSNVLNAAYEYLDNGWSVIPISADGKKPLVRWLEFQQRLPTEEEWEHWAEQWPDCGIGMVTGQISGFVVVDCDTDEAASEAQKLGLSSPCGVKTRRGVHYYFRHPGGERYGNRQGAHSRGDDWPQVAGLDFRGDGGYVKLPPSNNYSWIGDLDDAPDWVQPKLSNVVTLRPGDMSFSNLDLSHVTPADKSEWDLTKEYAAQFPHKKIPTGQGNSRNNRVFRFASECVLNGLFNDALRHECARFMAEFFHDPLDEREFEATVSSAESMERRNHPERFNDIGDYIGIQRGEPKDKEPSKVPVSTGRLLIPSQAAALLQASKSQHYLLGPWLRPATINQVYGYSGHGKSFLIDSALQAMASGQEWFGGWELGGKARVLKLDFEIGTGSLANRWLSLADDLGDPEDRFMVWTPARDETDMNLRTKEGRARLQSWIEETQPDVVVIDTVRSAFPGLEENKASEWAMVNTLCLKLRNAGYAVVMIHHANKPGELGLGREAGSSNQLTVLETQLRVTAVYKDEQMAQEKAGRWDGKYKSPVYPLVERQLKPHESVGMMLEVSYGKVREWSEAHDHQLWFALINDHSTGKQRWMGTASTKLRVIRMLRNGDSVEAVAKRVNRSRRIIEQWGASVHSKSTQRPETQPVQHAG
jgi:hypothetical protein